MTSFEFFRRLAAYVEVKGRTELRSERYKQFSVSVDPSCRLTLYKETILFVLDTPDCCGKSSNGWRLVSSTGISPPAGSLSAALIACDGSRTKNASTLGLWLNRSIIVPIACRRHIGSRPILIADCYSLLAENESHRPKNIQVKSRCFVFSRSWRSR